MHIEEPRLAVLFGNSEDPFGNPRSTTFSKTDLLHVGATDWSHSARRRTSAICTPVEQPLLDRTPEMVFPGDFERPDIAVSGRLAGWTALHVEHRITRRDGVMDGPIAFEEPLLIVQLQPARMWQRLDNASGMTSFGPGSTIALPRSAQVEWQWSRGAESVVFGVPPEAVDAVIVDRGTPRPFLRRLAGLAGRLLRDPGAHAAPDELLRHLLVCHLTGSGADEPSSTSAGLDRRRLEQAKEWLCASHGSPPSIEALATLLGMSRTSFTRAFTRATGVAPYAWFDKQRAEHAYLSVRSQPHRPLADVAASHGYADQAHMTRAFRRCLGVTPAQAQRGAQSYKSSLAVRP